MKPRCQLSRGAAYLAVLAALLLAPEAPAAQKLIRLRNELIATEPAPAVGAPQAKAAERAFPGLFLIQFTGPLSEECGRQLADQQVRLLHYVPDDCYIARGKNVVFARLRQLPFVQWVGPFRPEHKLHDSLHAVPGPAGALQGGPVSVLVAPDATGADLAGVRETLQRVERESHTRAGTVLRGQALALQLRDLAASDQVLWIEPGPRMRLHDEISTKIVAGPADPPGSLALVHQLGFDGAGVTIAVADSGLCQGDTSSMHPDLAGRVDAFFFYGTLESAADEHGHGTHVAGIVAGNAATGETDEGGSLYGLGVAPGAHLVAQRMFDGEGGYQPPATFGTMTRDALDAGAVIGSNSWGDDTQGRYDLSAMEFDGLVRDADETTPGDQPYILEFSAGNAGPGAQTVGSPAVGKNVIATGATDSERTEFLIYGEGPGVMADFSSRGPCDDGRIKPDVVAPGTWISSLRSAVGNDDNAWAVISDYYIYEGGTSQAGPHVSGAAAVFVQWYRSLHTNATPSPALVKAALINSTVDMESVAVPPNMDEGWGRVDLTQIIGSDRRYVFVDQSVLLRTGESYEQRVVIGNPDEPLRVTLAYTDVPAFPGAIPALVNDLDLEVVAPDGTLYRGNQFLEGESVPNASSSDNLNNVEGLWLSAPIPGEYVVRVRARKVAQDARLDTTGLDQDFALVISGSMPRPGEGVVVLDRRFYTVPGTLKISLVDSDLSGHASETVSVSSRTQTTPLTLTLFPSASPSVFTGSVATALAPAAADGRLHVAHGDVITVSYYDSSAAQTRTATAQADLVPPVLSNVSIVNEFGRVLVRWQTDEPANATVRFGTNTVPNLIATNRAFETVHEVELTNVVYGLTYHCVLSSTDEAGNSATNNNGGAGFTFVPARPANVLLVDSYVDEIFAVPPLSGYTTALNEAGIAYDLWNATTGVKPSFSVLHAYPAVIWRVSEFGSLMGWTDWQAADLQALTNYLAGGGSLLVASMELPSRLDEINAGWFNSNVLQIRAYTVDTGAPQLTGATSDPIGNGFTALLDYTLYEDEWKDLLGMPADVSDALSPTTNAAPILYSGVNQIAGLRSPKVGLDQAGRVVYLSFPLDAVPLAGNPANSRAALLKRILNWLAPAAGSSSIELDNSEYTVPSLVTVEVDAPNLKGRGQTTVQFTNTTLAAGLSATASETVRPGLFRARFVLVSTNGGDPTLQVRARHGDTLVASFRDPLAGNTVTASAVVATNPPLIFDVQSAPSYLGATISWETSKETDALVQFGESTFLGRSAYLDESDTLHEILADGLQPDRLYYYQVVSRDRAGNVAVDDNGGQFYTFRTLRPLFPPWTDDLETSSTDWAVYDADGTETSWTWGVPQNPPGVTAHSPDHAWGTSLQPGSLSQAETFLISPAILLEGGNQATLRFWQNYDFTEQEWDIFHYGELLLITNELFAPITLDSYVDWSDDWEEPEYDLTPYLGNVVYVVWHYVLFSLDLYPRVGWLVDDVSVTVSNIVPGTLLITNNLFQGGFVLTGPINRSAQGNSLYVSNALPGPYTVTFNSVPYYQTPAPQSGLLESSKLLVLQGNYTFADTNHNGLPDAWEARYLGGAFPNHPGNLDSDGDGQTDYGEFVAGTLPNDPTSRLLISSPRRLNDGTWTFGWSTVPGHGYRLESSSDLRAWSPLTDWQRASQTTNAVSINAATNLPSTFFRVRVAP